MNRVVSALSALLLIAATAAFAAPAEESAAGGRTDLNLALPGDPGNFDPATKWAS